MNRSRLVSVGILTVIMTGAVFLFVGRDNLAQAVNLSALEKLVQNKPSDDYFKGTNEYIDPSKNPKYTKNYNEIFFGSEGISVDELAELSQVVDLTENPTETPQAVMSVGDEDSVSVEVSKNKIKLKKDFEAKKSDLKKGKKNLKNEKSFETSKVMSVSFNADPSDEKVAELNFYRGKDENKEGLEKGLVELKEKVKTEKDATTKKKLEESVTKGNEQLAKVTTVVDQNKTKWESKKKEKSGIINKYTAKIQYAYSSPNKELMDILYPSKEAIDALNNEIEKERRQAWEWEQSQKGLKEVVLEEISKASPISKAFAWGDLSNNVNNLLVYSLTNQDMVWDVDNANAANGQTFKLWGRANDAPKQWKFVDSSSQIKFAGAGNMTKCVDVYLQNGSYDNGDIVSLYDCSTSKKNQKFVVFADGTIRPKYAQHMCLDASAGVNYGSKIHLWQCHGGANQQFNAGEYDWGERYYMRIYSANSLDIVGNSLIGHTLIATWRTGRGFTNTFSLWPKVDKNYSLTGGKSNNMYTSNNVMVDYYSGQFSDDKGKPKDWDIAYGGQSSKYRLKDIEISKQAYDEIRYMRGYLNGYQSIAYNWQFYNCAKYSVDLWNKYTTLVLSSFDSRVGFHTPGAVYSQL